MSISSAPAATASWVSASLTAQARPAARERRRHRGDLDPAAGRAPRLATGDQVVVDADRRPRCGQAGSVGSGRRRLGAQRAHRAVACRRPPAWSGRPSGSARSIAHALASVLIERVPSIAARASAPTSSTPGRPCSQRRSAWASEGARPQSAAGLGRARRAVAGQWGHGHGPCHRARECHPHRGVADRGVAGSRGRADPGDEASRREPMRPGPATAAARPARAEPRGGVRAGRCAGTAGRSAGPRGSWSSTGRWPRAPGRTGRPRRAPRRGRTRVVARQGMRVGLGPYDEPSSGRPAVVADDGGVRGRKPLRRHAAPLRVGAAAGGRGHDVVARAARRRRGRPPVVGGGPGRRRGSRPSWRCRPSCAGSPGGRRIRRPPTRPSGPPLVAGRCRAAGAGPAPMRSSDTRSTWPATGRSSSGHSPVVAAGAASERPGRTRGQAPAEPTLHPRAVEPRRRLVAGRGASWPPRCRARPGPVRSTRPLQERRRSRPRPGVAAPPGAAAPAVRWCWADLAGAAQSGTVLGGRRDRGGDPAVGGGGVRGPHQPGAPRGSSADAGGASSRSGRGTSRGSARPVPGSVARLSRRGAGASSRPAGLGVVAGEPRPGVAAPVPPSASGFCSNGCRRLSVVRPPDLVVRDRDCADGANSRR